MVHNREGRTLAGSRVQVQQVELTTGCGAQEGLNNLQQSSLLSPLTVELGRIRVGTNPVDLLLGREPIQILMDPARSKVEGLAVTSETHQPSPGVPIPRCKLLQQPGQGNDSARLVTMEAADHDQNGSVSLLAPGANHLGISVSTPTHRFSCISAVTRS